MSILTIGGTQIGYGERKHVVLRVAALYDSTEMTIPVEVIRGHEEGPTLFLSAAIHGDEINGTEIIKGILARKKMLANIKGTLIAVPIVNVFGFNRNHRYLPDRRDLNRSFPGTAEGSLAAQIANTFMKQIVNKSTHGIDLHTGSLHRYNLPQVRACIEDPETRRLAMAFGMPVTLNSSLRDGSLREAAQERGIPMLLFEGGEALRYDEKVIKTAIRGIVSVMHAINMVDRNLQTSNNDNKQTYIARSTRWLRAPCSGSLRLKKRVGSFVRKEDVLATISDPFGVEKVEMRACQDGIIIGMAQLPLVNRGDAVFHVASFIDSEAVKESVESLDDDDIHVEDKVRPI